MTGLTKVYLHSDVYNVCLLHALTTEKEEVMGLLIGEVDEESGISNICSCLILRRSDKQPDRVEYSDDQLIEATAYAEQLAHKQNKPQRVVGWYHSHPHITVWPSHVDVNTQAAHQLADPYFVGLIFSVFPNETRNKDGSSQKSNEIQLTCFQSKNQERVEIPLEIITSDVKDSNLEMMAQLPIILRQEEEEALAAVMASNEDSDGENDLLIDGHNQARKFEAMVNIIEKVGLPIQEAIATRLEANKARIAYLTEQEKKLQEEIDLMTLELASVSEYSAERETKTMESSDEEEYNSMTLEEANEDTNIATEKKNEIMSPTTADETIMRTEVEKEIPRTSKVAVKDTKNSPDKEIEGLNTGLKSLNMSDDNIKTSSGVKKEIKTPEKNTSSLSDTDNDEKSSKVADTKSSSNKKNGTMLLRSSLQSKALLDELEKSSKINKQTSSKKGNKAMQLKASDENTKSSKIERELETKSSKVIDKGIKTSEKEKKVSKVIDTVTETSAEKARKRPSSEKEVETLSSKVLDENTKSTSENLKESTG